MASAGAPIARPAEADGAPRAGARGPTGRRIGRYMVYAEIAKGGMASVHYGRLRGDGGFARTVAVKQLYPHLARDPQVVAAFFDEARVSSRLHHPNVVSTLDVVAGDGDAYLILDYVHGPSLAYLLRQERERGGVPDPRIGARVLVDALHGLHAAHVAKDEIGRPLGIVHRDVSPQNLLVGADGATRVVDFGVAKALGQAHVTNHGEVKGKLAYMAPEQLRGGKDVDCRSDVFAAGALLWELLAGDRLFAGEGDLEVAKAVLGAPIVPPSARRAGVPAALEAAALRALERDRDRRFQTASELALAIERALPDGLATMPEVAAWVDALAGDRLRRREAYLHAIEAAADGDEATVRREDDAATVRRGDDAATVRREDDAATVRREDDAATVRLEDDAAFAGGTVRLASAEAPATDTVTASGFRLTAAAAAAQGGTREAAPGAVARPDPAPEAPAAADPATRAFTPPPPRAWPAPIPTGPVEAPPRSFEIYLAAAVAVVALLVAVALLFVHLARPTTNSPRAYAPPAPTSPPAPDPAPTATATAPIEAVAAPEPTAAPEPAAASAPEPGPTAPRGAARPAPPPPPRPAKPRRGSVPVPEDYGF